MKDKSQKGELKKTRWLNTAVIVCAVVACGTVGILLYSCQFPKDSSSNLPPMPAVEQVQYTAFIKNWNQFADAFSYHYKLMGENAFSPDAVRKTLRKWCAALSSKPSAQYAEELAQLEDEIPSSTFHAYENFRKKHYREAELTLKEGMTERELARAVNEYAGVKAQGSTPDYVTQDTVKTILYMNNLCIFFKGEKDRLHGMGIDTNIYRCEDLTTNGKYPSLDKLLQ